MIGLEIIRLRLGLMNGVRVWSYGYVLKVKISVMG